MCAHDVFGEYTRYSMCVWGPEDNFVERVTRQKGIELRSPDLGK